MTDAIGHSPVFPRMRYNEQRLMKSNLREILQLRLSILRLLRNDSDLDS